ncbi:MAG: DUF1565 domain-containing protein [Acidimicrobiia bacterium]|nr:DUF1565 domain-containing protein [Acidimicrobiia bacterium]
MFRFIVLTAAMAVALATSAPTISGQIERATWFVDEQGSDAGAGTISDPWRTIQHAVDTAQPGDTIRVRPGTYAGARIEKSGTAGNRIKLLGSSAVINRPGPNNKHDSNLEIETWDGDGTVAYWTISGFEVTGAPNWGIDVRGNSSNHSHHITIQHTDVHHNGVTSIKTGIFFAFTDHVTVRENDSHHNGEHGVYLSNSGDHFTIKNNHLRSNARCGLHMNGDLSQGGDGLISHGDVVGNRINDNGAEGCAGINMDGVTDTTIRNNVIVENHASGIAVFRQDGAQCSRRNQILNNTVVQAAGGRWALVIGGAGCVDNTVRNNVLLTRHAFRGSIEMPTADVPGLVSNNNIVADRFTFDDGSSIVDLAGWRAATGQDADSFVATVESLFMAGTYRHIPGGVAEDVGAAVPNARGFDAVKRPAGQGFDIGAYETPYCHGERATRIGTRNADTIRATHGADVVAALDGPDIVMALRGNDVVCGGNGSDFLDGHRGRDTIHGGPGLDLLRGFQANDTLRGGEGIDEARGGSGVDDCSAETVVGCES